MAARNEPRMAKDSFTQGVALVCVVFLAAVCLLGPSGLLAWSDSSRRLAHRQSDLHTLTLERDALRNRVALLDPRHVDPDLAGELLRRNLNVVHPDEMVMLLN